MFNLMMIWVKTAWKFADFLIGFNNTKSAMSVNYDMCVLDTEDPNIV